MQFFSLSFSFILLLFFTNQEHLLIFVQISFYSLLLFHFSTLSNIHSEVFRWVALNLWGIGKLHLIFFLLAINSLNLKELTNHYNFFCCTGALNHTSWDTLAPNFFSFGIGFLNLKLSWNVSQIRNGRSILNKFSTWLSRDPFIEGVLVIF